MVLYGKQAKDRLLGLPFLASCAEASLWAGGGMDDVILFLLLVVHLIIIILLREEGFVLYCAMLLL